MHAPIQQTEQNVPPPGNVLDLDQDSTVVADEGSCAYVVHLRAVLGSRQGPAAAPFDLQQGSEWLWVVNNLGADTPGNYNRSDGRRPRGQTMGLRNDGE